MDQASLKLIRYVCSTPLHARPQGDAVVTIHAGAWAFCGFGASTDAHTWVITEGLPISAAMRLAQCSSADTPGIAATAPAGQPAAALTTRR